MARVVAFVVILLATLVGPAGGVEARQVELPGCGEYFAIASVGLEGRVSGDEVDDEGRVVRVGVANERDEPVMMPVGNGLGTWELVPSDGESVAFDADRSASATAESSGGSAWLGAGETGTLVLVFPGAPAGVAALRNVELGGVLSRGGVPVCGGNGDVGEDRKPGGDDEPGDDPSPSASPAGERDDERRPAATATAEPSDEPTVEPTATPRRPTETPDPTPTPRRPSPTPEPEDDATPDDIADLLADASWRSDEYIGDEPFMDVADCDELAGDACLYGFNDEAMIVIQVFDSERSCDRYLASEELDLSLLGTAYRGYDYAMVPSYYSDSGSAFGFAQVGQVLIFVAVEDPGARAGRGRDIDEEAESMLLGLIDRADRLVG